MERTDGSVDYASIQLVPISRAELRELREAKRRLATCRVDHRTTQVAVKNLTDQLRFANLELRIWRAGGVVLLGAVFVAFLVLWKS